MLGLSPAVDPSSLCGRVTTIYNELGLGWLPCEATQKVVCFSDEKTDAEVRPAGYQPSMSVLYGDRLIQPRASADEMLVVTRTSLDDDFSLNITCGPGDSIVKDHFVLGKTQYLTSWWSNNFTIMQTLPLDEGSRLGVGTYWCRRYVDEEVDPAVSGRLHVATSTDTYVLTVPERGVLKALQLLLSDDAEYDDGSGSGPSLSGEYADVVTALGNFLRSVEVRFLALYDFPNSRAMRQESEFVTEEMAGRRTGRIVSLIIEPNTVLDGAFLRGANGGGIGNAEQNELFVMEVFRCADENVDGHTWRQSSSGVGSPSFEYTASAPACVAADLPALVERRCRPSFDRDGAQWGPLCAAGVCRNRFPQCKPPPPICPPGFTSTTDVSSEVHSHLCLLLLTDITFEERGSACRRQDPAATPWFPRQRLLQLSFMSPPLVNQTLWLPFRRLWSQGSLLPKVASLLNRDDRAVVSLQDDLDCTVVTSLGWLASSSCRERHAVVCVTTPLYSHGKELALQRPNVIGRPCQSLLGLGTTPTGGSERCFAFLCSNTSAPIRWSEASSLCTDSNSSLASLTSRRQLDAVIRLGRARERPARTAVNLERHEGRVVWGDGTPLSYPALSPYLSRAEQHTHGILDISRGQYDFAGSDHGAVNCALCDKTIKIGPPEIILFYGSLRRGMSIFANVTNVQHFVTDWEGTLSCFASTAEAIGIAASPPPSESLADVHFLV